MQEYRPIVAFYDRCMPQTPLKYVMYRLAGYSHHIFLKSQSGDYELLTLVERMRRERFPESTCLFFTLDGKDFLEKTKDHPARENTVKIHVIRIEPEIHLRNRNWEIARAAAFALASAYADVLKHSSQKKDAKKP